MVNLICNNPALRGAEVAVGETGTVVVGPGGAIQTEESLAAVLVAIPGYAPASEEDAKTIKEFVSRSVQTPEGLYDPGETTRIFIPQFVGTDSAVCASDNIEVKFDSGGYGYCGRNTAMALLAVFPDAALSSLDGTKVEAKAPSAPPATVVPRNAFEPIPLPPEYTALDEELCEEGAGSSAPLGEELPETLEDALSAPSSK